MSFMIEYFEFDPLLDGWVSCPYADSDTLADGKANTWVLFGVDRKMLGHFNTYKEAENFAKTLSN